MVRTMTITPALNGFIVQVGCTTLVSMSLSVMCHEIERYYTDPDQVEKEYLLDALNKIQPDPPECQAESSLRTPRSTLNNI